MKNAATQAMNDIQVALVKTGRCLLWRNNSGIATYGRAKVRYGLGLGGADLVGVISSTGRFFAIEVKTGRGELEPDQERWHAAVRAAGGFVATCHNVHEALHALERAEQGYSEPCFCDRPQCKWLAFGDEA